MFTIFLISVFIYCIASALITKGVCYSEPNEVLDGRKEKIIYLKKKLLYAINMLKIGTLKVEHLFVGLEITKVKSNCYKFSKLILCDKK